MLMEASEASRGGPGKLCNPGCATANRREVVPKNPVFLDLFFFWISHHFWLGKAVSPQKVPWEGQIRGSKESKCGLGACQAGEIGEPGICLHPGPFWVLAGSRMDPAALERPSLTEAHF